MRVSAFNLRPELNTPIMYTLVTIQKGNLASWAGYVSAKRGKEKRAKEEEKEIITSSSLMPLP